MQQTLNGQTTTFTMDYNMGLTQALSDGMNTYIYGNERLAQVNTGTEYFLGDALGSVRQLTNTGGAVTYASAYDPYGVTTQTYGSTQSAYGYTNEYESQGLIYLRSRIYDPEMGRFLTRDTWGGSIVQPISLNRFIYAYNNSINFIDPSGLCPTCVVYFFPGAGNKGDLDDQFGGTLDGRLDDNLGPNERVFVQLLRQRGISVGLVYPYGAGIRTNWDKDYPIHVPILNLDLDSNGNFRYAMLPSAYNLSTIPKTKADEIIDPRFETCKQEDKWNVTFIGYSGGGQMAYSTAQELTGRIFVDNLVLLGAAFRAYNGLGNIGHIWDLVGQNDTDLFGKGGEKKLGWDRYNSGYRYIPTYETIYDSEEDIYQYGATKCTLYGPHYIHYGCGDYLQPGTNCVENKQTINVPFNGALCSGGGMLPGFPLPANDKSRLENLVNFLIDVVGIGRQK